MMFLFSYFPPTQFYLFNLAGALLLWKDNILDNNKKKTGILLLALILF